MIAVLHYFGNLNLFPIFTAEIWFSQYLHRKKVTDYAVYMQSIIDY